MKERIEWLRKEVEKHDNLYDAGQPVITDTEYDELYRELRQLEEQYPEFQSEKSPTKLIISKPVKGLAKVRHTTPVISLNKDSEKEGFKRVKKLLNDLDGDFILQDKMDGLTVVLEYENGEFYRGASRGDGTIGEDITNTVREVANFPKKISIGGNVKIRCEFIIPTSHFEKINTNGKYSTTRNLVSGTLRQLDASVVKERGVQAIALEVVEGDLGFTTDTEQLDWLQSQGFAVVKTYKISGTKKEKYQQIKKYVKEYQDSIREKLDYVIDGLVLKIDNLQVRVEEGTTEKHPKWAIAIKFPSQNATSTLREIVVQIGRTGQLSPVAIYDDVLIDNVKYQRATLHNFSMIRDKDIRIGDKILVERAKDVIPQVVKAFPELRETELEVYQPPTECPFCHTKTQYDGEHLYCVNDDCLTKQEEKIIHFVSRKALNVEDFGEKMVRQLFAEGLIKSILDLYTLADKEEEFVKLDRLGKTTFDKIVAELEKSKFAPFHKVLFGLGIKEIGESASKTLANHFTNIDNLLSLSEKSADEFYQQVLSLDDFGDKTTRHVVQFFTSENGKALVKGLLDVGFVMGRGEKEKVIGNKLQGMTFVITGKLSRSRDEIKEEIESLGGKVAGSVSKKTTYLLLGSGEEGSSKHTKALELGTTIISEEQYLELI